MWLPSTQKLPVVRDILALVPKLATASQKKAATVAAIAVEEAVKMHFVESCLFHTVVFGKVFGLMDVPHRMRAGYLCESQFGVLAPHAWVEVEGKCLDIASNNALPLLQFLKVKRLSGQDNWQTLAASNGFPDEDIRNLELLEVQPSPSLNVLGHEVKTWHNSKLYQNVTSEKRKDLAKNEFFDWALQNTDIYEDGMPDPLKAMMSRIIDQSLEEAKLLDGVGKCGRP